MQKKLTLGLLGAALIASAAFMFSTPPTRAEQVTVYKTPQCGCCEDYASHLRRNGYSVTVKVAPDLAAMSRKEGIPDDFQGCHLAYFGKYVVSGHVPLSAVNKLLAERPAIKGIALPGMPAGSPGMPGPKIAPFQVYTVGKAKPQLYSTE
jgi:hypothetical protein